MSWGHAVSKNLLQWEELDQVMYPDRDGTIFSGCGWKQDEKLMFYYTSAGGDTPWSKDRGFVQKLAISTDGGMTLQKQPEIIVDKIGKDTRDPKIFWHEETKAYIMVIYIEGNEFGILRSTDMYNWEISQRFELEEAWECPNLMKVPTEEGGHKWMFWSADGFYYWGEFDGYRFTTDGKKHMAYLGTEQYAAQTYAGVEDRIIQISWLRLENTGEVYTGAMGIPREIICRKKGDDYVLVQKPVRELKATTQGDSPVKIINIDLEEKFGQLVFNINRSKIEITEELLTIDDKKYRIVDKVSHIQMIVDNNIIEVAISHDIIIGVFKLKNSHKEFKYKLTDKAQICISVLEETWQH